MDAHMGKVASRSGLIDDLFPAVGLDWVTRVQMPQLCLTERSWGGCPVPTSTESARGEVCCPHWTALLSAVAGRPLVGYGLQSCWQSCLPDSMDLLDSILRS